MNSRDKNSIKEYKFNDAADSLYQFIWKDYCDWYIEFIKPILNNSSNIESLNETKNVSIDIMNKVLLMLHPIMPYLTEEIFEKLFQSSQLAISSSWPQKIKSNKSLENGIDLLIKLVSTLRSIRVEKNIPSKSRPIIFLKNIDLEKRKIIDENKNLIINLAKLNEIKFSSVNEEFENDKFIITTIDEITLMISLDGLIDTESERSRLNKELTNINNEIEIISKRLNNPMFVDKAPSKVVIEVKNKKKVFNQRKVEIEKALKNL